MIEPLLKSQLEPVARRQRQLQVRRNLAICWAAAAAMGFGWMALQRLSGLGGTAAVWFLLAGAGLAALIVRQQTLKWEPDYREIVRRIEQHHPQLHALLLTAVEQKPDARTGRLNYLQERVIREAILEGLKEQWIGTVSSRRLRAWQGARLTALALLVAALAGMHRTAPGPTKTGMAVTKGVTIIPGDADVERGNRLVVLARFDGKLPAETMLVISASADDSRRIPLVKNLEDPVFGGSIPEVNSDLLYHIEYAGHKTRSFKVRVFEHPRLEHANAKITFPEYTGLPEKEIKDTHRISAVEGSLLDLSLQLNKPVASARLIGKDKSVVPLVAATNRASVALKGFPLLAGKTYQLQLVDAEGRTNKVPAQFVIDVLKNRRPELKIASPRGDQRVSPLEEIAFQAEAWDDFGLRAYGLTYRPAGGEARDITIDGPAAANEKRQFNHLLSLEQLGMAPDQLIIWFLWAEDIGPDGQPRRTAGDMYFAEVRPFEEIFREGQSLEGQGGQQQQQGGEATKLAELQKQIINATWKVQRQDADAVNIPKTR